MKKFLLFLIFLTTFVKTYAQLDREHWFAPMIDRTYNGSQYQSIYMSTNESTPFKVDIYQNNIVVGSVTISKNNPAKYSINSSSRDKIITTNDNDLFKPVAMGYFLKGEKPFYASLRFSVRNHGEILTSKGGAALGTEFRAVMAPITVYNDILNFMNSVMATENNTTVTISGFKPNVRFTDGVTRTQITFTLNRGQSYIVEGIGDNTNNFTGYIGAKIVADKPIVITNGNFNGQYAGNFINSSDILMDQGVPIDKLGQEFVLMKGNGEINNNMEKAIVLATEDDTKIYINNGGTAIATLNAGQYYTTDNNAYINQGNGHYNMFIKATKNIYVYQLLAGTGTAGGSEEATGGMNYIPPLSCYLPKKIDEIGRIDENEYASNTQSYKLNVPTKLNIITEKGATVTVQRNGINLPLTAANGPYDVTGNNNWVTYSVPNVSGNIAVASSHAVTAGISAGDNSVGYGGYFAGFSYIPAVIKREGECLPGVKLEVTEGFNTYQWLLKNASGAYVPAPGVNNTHIYNPSQAGIYAVKIQQGSCPEIQTQDFKFYNCTTYTNYDYDICTTEVITPQFSLSSQAINNTTVKIDTPPTKGTVTIAANGQLTYTANPDATGTDSFKYSFCGTGQIADCETAKATINLNQIIYEDKLLEECSATNTATYDLTKAIVTTQTVTKAYYKTLLGAQNQTAADLIPTITAYTSPDTTVYVRLANAFGCVSYAKIELKIKPLPIIQPNLYTKLHCDEDIDGKIDGIYRVDLTQITPTVLQNAATFVVKYYDTEAKANTGGTDNIATQFTFTNNSKIWIRVESTNGCTTVKAIDLTIGTKTVLTNATISHDVCSITNNTTESVNLSNYTGLFNANTGITATYYLTLLDAESGINPTTVQQNIPLGVSTFYYRLSSATTCANVGQLNITLKKGLASTTLPASVTICEDATTLLNVGTGFTGFVWYNAATNTTIGSAQTITVPPGQYYVDLTSNTGCIYRQYVEVKSYTKAVLTPNLYNATKCDDNLDGSIDVNFSQDVTPKILQNHTVFQIRYYDTQAKAIAGGNNNLQNVWSYNTDTTVWVRVDSQYCPYTITSLDFKIGNKIQLLNKEITTSVCDDNLDGKKEVNLETFRTLFTANLSVSMSYYSTLLDAQNKTNPISKDVTITNNRKFYLRFESGSECPEIGELTITIKIPKTSTILVDQVICPENTTTLDAGAGFTKYTWSTGATTQKITNIGVGDYWVDLEFDGCTYRQNVKVTATDLPIIKAIDIDGTTVTVTAEGGRAPYMYRIDNGIYQTSPIFTNVAPGNHTLYVISKDQCAPIKKEFSVIRILNAFTPNGDNYNDIIDYSGLLTKEEPKLIIIDRYGKKVFDSEVTKTFIWDGKTNGTALPTASYWYVLEWKEFGISTKIQKTGWILLKSR